MLVQKLVEKNKPSCPAENNITNYSRAPHFVDCLQFPCVEVVGLRQNIFSSSSSVFDAGRGPRLRGGKFSLCQGQCHYNLHG